MNNLQYVYYNRFDQAWEATTDKVKANNVGFYSKQPVRVQQGERIVETFKPNRILKDGLIDKGFHNR